MNAYEELVSRIKKVPISRLGDVVAAMEGKLEARGFSKKQLEQAGAISANVALDRELVGCVSVETIAKALLDCVIDIGDVDKLDAVEREYCRLALKRANGNKSQAARLAGLERKAFARRLQKHGVR